MKTVTSYNNNFFFFNNTSYNDLRACLVLSIAWYKVVFSIKLMITCVCLWITPALTKLVRVGSTRVCIKRNGKKKKKCFKKHKAAFSIFRHLALKGIVFFNFGGESVNRALSHAASAYTHHLHCLRRVNSRTGLPCATGASPLPLCRIFAA